MLKKRGFTLIELMIVVAIIGILAAIAIPKFADLVRKSQEASTKGNLGAIRSALSIYYGDLEGRYPDNLGNGLTTNAKYLASIPVAQAPTGTLNSSGVENGPLDTAANVNSTVADCNSANGWAYDNVTTRTSYGTVLVNCNLTDTKGTLWTSY